MATGRVPTTANSPLTAKGDLFGYSTTQARVAVGNDGETLVADSSTSTGLRWQGAVVGGSNFLINSNFDWWQRGSTFTAAATGAYTADRFSIQYGGTSINPTVSRDTGVPNAQSKYSLKVLQATSNATSVTTYASRQIFEASTLYGLIGKNVTISFWYKSNKTGSHGIRFYGAYLTGGTDDRQGFTVNAADTWEKKTITSTALAAVTTINVSQEAAGALLDIGFRVQDAGFTSVSANDYYQISQIKVEVGSVATPFSTATGTLQGELSACQRYYYRTGAASNDPLSVGAFATSTICNGITTFPVAMRTSPTALEQSGTAADYRLLFNNGNATCSAVPTFAQASQYMARIAFTIATGGTQGYGATFASNATTGYLAWSAEL